MEEEQEKKIKTKRIILQTGFPVIKFENSATLRGEYSFDFNYKLPRDLPASFCH
jgi:hypothetical protein